MVNCSSATARQSRHSAHGHRRQRRHELADGLACGSGWTTTCRRSCSPSSTATSWSGRLDDGGRRPLSVPKSAAWSGRSCCSARHGLEGPPAGDGPLAIAASACAAMPRSIPRSSTSARACGSSSRCGTRVGERVTDLIFRMEAARRGFRRLDLGRKRGHPRRRPRRQRHDRPAAISRRPIDDSETPTASWSRSATVGERVGRNDPCPCGSGKKFKNCCMRTTGRA